MKNILENPNFNNKENLLRMWKTYSHLMEQDETDENIEKGNKLICEIEQLMPFKSKEEHEHWLDVGMSSTCWDDFEELTMEIINRADQTPTIEPLLSSYCEVAMDVCKDANFYDLFNTFAKLSQGWLKPMSEWNDFYKSMSNDEWIMGCFHDCYKEVYRKQYQLKDLLMMRYYGFEDTPNCMFYKNDVESKSNLMDCIFERYLSGLEDDEKLWFLQRLIKELI